MRERDCGDVSTTTRIRSGCTSCPTGKTGARDRRPYCGDVSDVSDVGYIAHSVPQASRERDCGDVFATSRIRSGVHVGEACIVEVRPTLVMSDTSSQRPGRLREGRNQPGDIPRTLPVPAYERVLPEAGSARREELVQYRCRMIFRQGSRLRKRAAKADSKWLKPAVTELKARRRWKEMIYSMIFS